MNKFIYIHIPRCAGTTNRDVLRSTFGRTRVYRDLSFKKEPRLHKNKNKGEELVVNRFVLCDKIFQKNFRVINWEDFDVIFGHFTIRKYALMEWPFVTFLREPIERVISEYSVLRREDKKFKGLSLIEYAYLNRNLITWMMGEDINKFLFIGFTEKYEESMNKLENLLNKKIIRIASGSNHRNFKFPKYVITEEERKEIESYNQLDIDLYNKALKRFL